MVSLSEFGAIFAMQGFNGLSVFCVLLLMALGLAIIFGQMGVINMAHGEFMTIGAYTIYLLSHLAATHAPGLVAYYFPFAIVAAQFSQSQNALQGGDLGWLQENRIDPAVLRVAQQMPIGPHLYPDDVQTDEPEETLMAELIREAALEGVHDELPHSLAVVIDEVEPHEGRDDMIDVHAILYVERDSQKGIVIGPQGSRLRAVGTHARKQIEALLGTKVYLDLHVKVAKDWQRDPKQLQRLGF